MSAKLKLVPADLNEIREASAREGKHVCDHMRSEIAKRDWSAMHVAASRRPPIDLPDVRKGFWWR